MAALLLPCFLAARENLFANTRHAVRPAGRRLMYGQNCEADQASAA
jgi:hypothetical protein